MNYRFEITKAMFLWYVEIYPMAERRNPYIVSAFTRKRAVRKAQKRADKMDKAPDPDVLYYVTGDWT